MNLKEVFNRFFKFSNNYNLREKYQDLNNVISNSLNATNVFIERKHDKLQQELWKIAEDNFNNSDNNGVVVVYVRRELYEYAKRMLRLWNSIRPIGREELKYYLTPFCMLDVKLLEG